MISMLFPQLMCIFNVHIANIACIFYGNKETFHRSYLRWLIGTCLQSSSFFPNKKKTLLRGQPFRNPSSFVSETIKYPTKTTKTPEKFKLKPIKIDYYSSKTQNINPHFHISVFVVLLHAKYIVCNVKRLLL